MQTIKNSAVRVNRRSIGILRTIVRAQENQVGRKPNDPNRPTSDRVRSPNGHQEKQARILCMTGLLLYSEGERQKQLIDLHN